MPRAFGIVGVPKRSGGPLAKPPPNAVIDWDHPLANGLDICIPLHERSGRPRDLASKLIASFAGTGAAWSAEGINCAGTGSMAWPARRYRLSSGTVAWCGYASSLPVSGVKGLFGFVTADAGAYFQNSSAISNLYNCGQTPSASFATWAAGIPYHLFITKPWTGNVVVRTNHVTTTSLGSTWNIPSGSDTLYLGNDQWAGEFWPGTVLHFFAWSRQLNHAETEQVYRSPYQFLYVPKRRVFFVPSGGGATTYTVTHTSDSRILTPGVSLTKTSDSRILTPGIASTKTSDARILKAGVSISKTSDARILKSGVAATKTSDARILKSGVSLTKTSDSRILKHGIAITKTADADIFVAGTAITKTSDARILKSGIAITKTSDAEIVASPVDTYTITKTADADIFVAGTAITKTSDARILKVGVATTKTSDARIVRHEGSTETSDAHIVRVESLTKTSDSRIIKSEAIDLTSDARITLATTNEITHTSDADIFGTSVILLTSDARIAGRDGGRPARKRARRQIYQGRIELTSDAVIASASRIETKVAFVPTSISAISPATRSLSLTSGAFIEHGIDLENQDGYSDEDEANNAMNVLQSLGLI